MPTLTSKVDFTLQNIQVKADTLLIMRPITTPGIIEANLNTAFAKYTLLQSYIKFKSFYILWHLLQFPPLRLHPLQPYSTRTTDTPKEAAGALPRKIVSYNCPWFPNVRYFSLGALLSCSYHLTSTFWCHLHWGEKKICTSDMFNLWCGNAGYWRQ